MAPKFGTSGLRGLVRELSASLVTDYTHAFLTTVRCDRLYAGRDLRPSSPGIVRSVCRAASEAGVEVVDCGTIATPALAFSSLAAGAAAIMVTGSHVPADRNGLKFYLPDGEVLKADEAKIGAAYVNGSRRKAARSGTIRSDMSAERHYVARYVTGFGPGALKGLRLGVYRHSSVARDTFGQILKRLGAEVVELGHSEVFVPVDTEAIDRKTAYNLRDWSQNHRLDAIVSSDGDADRPMLTDATGKLISGDILGVLTARILKAKSVVTPVSSNDMVRRLPMFEEVILTKIGSPFVLEAMAKAKHAEVVGFEANGGFILGFEATVFGPLAPLPTRDAMLPILGSLLAAKRADCSLAELVAGLPPCVSVSDRLQRVDLDKARAFLSELIEDRTARAAFFASLGEISSADLTDGLRVTFTSGEVLHLRPSGNAPEFRIYAQSASESRAQALVRVARETVGCILKSPKPQKAQIPDPDHQD
ncbi:phosphomannomutase [Celeribacter neptunius]|uniref:Phosphomannomutase n=1 Tax=Celeribacter neptunius TaxID=588602 RepID=A0A1I3SGX3_9RHOB|nr:phosphomannomutase [Celeribacter neptunius]SFJ56871.1 phosphomannomutase [Celeribacter neptunius]